MTRALVCFSDNVGMWWLRLLRPGFRHCFVVLEMPPGWVVVESLSHCVKVAAVPANPAADYRARGLVVVETRIAEPAPLPLPWRPFTCVEAAKRILGLRASWVVTPWQLFTFLARDRKIIIDGGDDREYKQSHQHQNCVRIQPSPHRPTAFLSSRKEQMRIISRKEPVMGGFFSAPSSPPPPPPPAPSPGPSPQDEERKQRMEAMARNRRGRQGLTVTSDHGLLQPVAGASKTLLGE